MITNISTEGGLNNVEEKVFYRNQQVNNIDIYYEFYPNPDSKRL